MILCTSGHFIHESESDGSVKLPRGKVTVLIKMGGSRTAGAIRKRVEFVLIKVETVVQCQDVTYSVESRSMAALQGSCAIVLLNRSGVEQNKSSGDTNETDGTGTLKKGRKKRM